MEKNMEEKYGNFDNIMRSKAEKDTKITNQYKES